MIEALKLLADYNKKADARMISILTALPEESLRRDLGTFFKSIADTLLHVAASDITWAKRIRGFLTYTCIEQSALADITNDDLLASYGRDSRALFALKEKLDELFVAIVTETKPEDLGRRFRYTSISGKVMEKTYWHMLLQTLNHGTHHRGAISAMLDILKIDNDFSGIVLYTE